MSREAPILFSGPMVRAILEGRKTQTRRIVKPQTLNVDADLRCPYGAPGDRLWVRETWQTLHHNGVRVVYRADGEDPRTGWDDVPPERRPRMTWRPSIFLPRQWSRITLEVTEVRVERLQDITEEDAIAEGMVDAGERGVWGDFRAAGLSWGNARPAFHALWNEINGKGAPWSSNPWVHVIHFRKLER